MAEQRTLEVTSWHGLSNRLRVLLSGMALAEATGRRFSMDWVPSQTCTCPFDLLFEGDWHIHPTAEIDLPKWRDLRYISPQKFPNLLEADEPHLCVFHYGWLIDPARFPDQLPVARRVRELFDRLQPIPPLAERIKAFQAEFFRPAMVGVHVRRGDYIPSRPHLVNNMDATLQAVDRMLDLAPEAGILLCTDDGAPFPLSGQASPYAGVREKFRERYGERVVWTTPRSLDRTSREAIQDAVVDLWLLRRTQFFVGTGQSTFSEFAVYGRDLPFVMTAGATTAFEKRRRRLKRSGIYYVVLALGQLEFGVGTPFEFTVGRYKDRMLRLKKRLK